LKPELSGRSETDEQFRYGVALKNYPFKRECPERAKTSSEYEIPNTNGSS
jgi:hypothetical protein